MNAVLNRDPFMPRPPRGMGAGLGLALLAHALLIVALAFGVNWRSHELEGVEAELWSAVPQFEAPRAVVPPPTPAPPEPKRPEPVAKAPPVREPAPAPDPQIAIEQAKRDKAKLEQTERERAERDKAKRDKAAREEDERAQQRSEQAKKKQQADKDRAEAEKLAEAREANLQRMLGQAGATGGATANGAAARSSGPSASYAGRIMARIKPNIVFTDPLDGNPIATVEVRLAPDGTIIGKRLVKSSGVKSWDEAVLRAIERTEVLPRDTDGRVPGPFEIDFKRRD